MNQKRTSQRVRCPWCGEGDALYQAYHDEEWGVPLRDPARLFELLMLEGMQAGLAWRLILERREQLRAAFMRFDPKRLAKAKPDAADQIILKPGVIRHRQKIAAVLSNARAFVELSAKQKFDEYLWAFVDHQPIINRYASMSAVPAKTDASIRMSKALMKDGFKFVGPTICYAFMQAAGMVNDHLLSCFRHTELSR